MGNNVHDYVDTIYSIYSNVFNMYMPGPFCLMD